MLYESKIVKQPAWNLTKLLIISITVGILIIIGNIMMTRLFFAGESGVTHRFENDPFSQGIMGVIYFFYIIIHSMISYIAFFLMLAFMLTARLIQIGEPQKWKVRAAVALVALEEAFKIALIIFLAFTIYAYGGVFRMTLILAIQIILCLVQVVAGFLFLISREARVMG